MAMEIVILGEECPECNELEEHLRLALEQLGITDAEIHHTWDIREEIERYGEIKVPGLIVNGTIVLRGGPVPDVATLVRMIEDEEWEA